MKKVIIISVISVFILVISIIILVSCNSGLPEVGENPKDLSNLVIDNESHTITYQYLSEVDLSTEYFFENTLYNRKIYKNDIVVSQITFDPTGNNVYKVELIYKKTVISYTVILDTSRVVAVYGVNGTLTGYIFKDEANKINSSDLSSLAGASVAQWFTTSAFNQVANLDNYSSNAIYAKGIDSYTLTFDSNGGSFVNSIIKDKDSVITIPDNPTKAGYSFNGWYDNKQLNGDAVVFPYTLSGDVTLYAKWIVIDYSITYQLNGGTNHASNPDGYNIEDAIILQNPTRVGYTFAGWINEEGIPTISILKGHTGNITLYAQWLEIYYIEYELNGGTNHPINPEKYDVESNDITLYNPTRVGYIFDSWFNESNHQVVTVINQGSTGNIKLYAKWKVLNYKIDYFLNSGTNHASNPVNYNIETSDITLNAPTRNGYTFKGWFNDANFNGTEVTGIILGTTEDIKLYAKWEITIYTIDYNLNDGDDETTKCDDNPTTYTVETQDFTLEIPTRDGYTFEGWFDESNKQVVTINQASTGNIKLSAKWKVLDYKIDYFLNGGANHANNPETYTIEDTIELNTPTRAGYAFKGWFDNASFSDTAVTGIALGSTEDIKLYAKWEITTYDIIYVLNESDYSPVTNDDNPTTYTVETKDFTLKVPTRDGYTFEGWFDESNKQVVTINKGSTVNITLTARWEIITYTAYFCDNNGSGLFYSEDFTIEDGITFPTTSSTGLELIGWFTATDVMVEEFIYDTQEVKVFYAHYNNLPKIWQGRGEDYNEREDLYYIEFGMYPQTVVPFGELHDKLTANYEEQTDEVIATGKSYTANKDWEGWSLDNQELNYEYSYLGTKYVKVTPYASGTNATTYVYNNNGGAIGQNSGIRWFKVEPIKWIILNNPSDFIIENEEHGITVDLGLPSVPQGATLELYAADVLMGGIAFDNYRDEKWNLSSMKTYLNSDFYSQAFSNTDKEQIQVSTIYNNSGNSDYNHPAYGLNSNHYVGTGYNPTDQYLYLLSYYEMFNAASPYVGADRVFEDSDASSTRQVNGTDYARAHNLYLEKGSPCYWIRTAHSINGMYCVLRDGSLGVSSPDTTDLGTRPALQLKPQS